MVPLLGATCEQPSLIHQASNKSYIKNHTYRLYIPPFFHALQNIYLFFAKKTIRPQEAVAELSNKSHRSGKTSSRRKKSLTEKTLYCK
jgi:hypothetical protein